MKQHSRWAIQVRIGGARLTIKNGAMNLTRLGRTGKENPTRPLRRVGAFSQPLEWLQLRRELRNKFTSPMLETISRPIVTQMKRPVLDCQ